MSYNRSLGINASKMLVLYLIIYKGIYKLIFVMIYSYSVNKPVKLINTLLKNFSNSMSDTPLLQHI